MKSIRTNPVSVLLVLFIISALIASSLRADLPFVIVGDWGTPLPAASGQREVAAQMGRTAADIGSRCVVTVGDNFHAKGIQGTDDPLWQALYERVYTAPSLQTPWYPALGNHDYDGNPQAEVEYAKHSPRWRMLDRYYTWTDAVDAETVAQFFILDSSPFIEEYAEKKFASRGIERPDWRAQLAWLESELAASKAKWKIVVAHHPVYSGGKKHGDTPELVKYLKPLVDKYGVQIVLSGHEHDFQHLNDGGTAHYFVISGGSVKRPAAAQRFTVFCQGDTHGFGTVILKRDTAEVRFVDKDGNVFYEVAIPATHERRSPALPATR